MGIIFVEGSGGVTNKTVGLYGVVPVTQAAHIIDATDTASAITRINAILVALENIGVTASS